MPLDQRASEGIRYQTITLISLFDPIKQDARKLDQSDKICDTVTRVIKELKRFEKVPKRCEAYTIAMHRRLFETTRFVSKDCSNAANFDWNGVGLQGGNRRSEWCQDRGSDILQSEIQKHSLFPILHSMLGIKWN
jgi:hypothetical protein